LPVNQGSRQRSQLLFPALCWNCRSLGAGFGVNRFQLGNTFGKVFSRLSSQGQGLSIPFYGGYVGIAEGDNRPLRRRCRGGLLIQLQLRYVLGIMLQLSPDSGQQAVSTGYDCALAVAGQAGEQADGFMCASGGNI